MNNVKITMDRVKIDPKKLGFSTLVPSLKKSMFAILADHARKQGRGQTPSGKRQKRNSKEYAARKANPGIKVGARRLSGNTPTVLSGELAGSRQVVAKQNEVLGVFAGGDNAQKARWITAKGYSIAHFTKQNMDMISKNAAKDLNIDAAITIERSK